MISREAWEDAVKSERQEILNRTHDQQYRRMVAAVIDAFSDRLYDRLEENSRIMGGNQNG